MSEILRVAVVGHTNAGKTSLLRTLARDAAFGEVSDRPATTRQVAGVALLVDGQEVAHFFDTPGLEDSIGLLEHLDELCGGRRLDGPAQIAAFLEGEEASRRFAPEAMAIRAVLDCHAAIYVIDVRDRVLPKHRDELEILARCGRPVVPLLNFVAAPGNGEAAARVAEWRQTLSRLNLHAVVEFDTVVFDQEGEIRLFEKLATLLDRFREPLARLAADRARRQARLGRAAAGLVAELLVDAASLVETTDRDERDELRAAEERLRERVRRLEERCVRELLILFQFRPGDLDAGELPLVEGRWGIDLFSPAAIRQHGLRAGGGAAAGAAVGAGIDLAVGGMSLGAAAGIGALVGAALGGLGGASRKLIRRAQGGNELRVGETTLRLLARRQLELVRALQRRGHASVAPLKLGAEAAASAFGGVSGSASDRAKDGTRAHARRDDAEAREDSRAIDAAIAVLRGHALWSLSAIGRGPTSAGEPGRDKGGLLGPRGADADDLAAHGRTGPGAVGMAAILVGADREALVDRVTRCLRPRLET